MRTLDTLLWFRNEIDFWIRSRIHLRRGPAHLLSEAKDELFPPAVQSAADRLVRLYALHHWQSTSRRTDFAASLFYGAMIEEALQAAAIALPDPVVALDAGAGDWFYVQVLHAILQRHGADRPRRVHLDGVEVDAYALYDRFYARLDMARAFVGDLPGVRYLPVDIRSYQETAHVVFWLFPFLFPAELRRWGLPRRYLRPAELLAHLQGRIRPGGYLVVANLGEAERDRQVELLQSAGMTILWQSPATAPFFHYGRQPYVLVARPAYPEERWW